MSVQAMVSVLSHSRSRLAARLVLLMLADQADEDFRVWWEGDQAMRCLEARTNLNHGEVIAAVEELEVMGELEPVSGRVYRISLPRE